MYFMGWKDAEEPPRDLKTPLSRPAAPSPSAQHPRTNQAQSLPLIQMQPFPNEDNLTPQSSAFQANTQRANRSSPPEFWATAQLASTSKQARHPLLEASSQASELGGHQNEVVAHLGLSLKSCHNSAGLSTAQRRVWL